MKDTGLFKKIGILDWLIFFSILIMFIMVYVPQKIWAEEEEYKQKRREKMQIISQAEEFYYELTGEYSTDYRKVFSLVEAAMDSLIADSLFVGNKKIFLNNKEYDVNLEKGYEMIVDTTFSYSENIKKIVKDTIYTIGMNNPQTNQLDTIVVNSTSISNYQNDSLFSEVYNIEYKDRIENEINYLRRKFHLTDDLIYCPISKSNKNKKFILKIEKNPLGESVFNISSPITPDDKERRYMIFSYSPGSEESIIGGQKSWAGN